MKLNYTFRANYALSILCKRLEIFSQSSSSLLADYFQLSKTLGRTLHIKNIYHSIKMNIKMTQFVYFLFNTSYFLQNAVGSYAYAEIWA